MGILISLPLITHRGIEKLRAKRKARKARKAEDNQPQLHSAEAQPQPRRTLSSDKEERDSIEILRQGLLDEHLATVPPPIPSASTELKQEGKEERGIAG